MSCKIAARNAVIWLIEEMVQNMHPPLTGVHRSRQTEYHCKMRWKSIFAAMLALLLVTVSSSAAVCEAACAAQGTVPACHSSGTSSNPQPSSMSQLHCHMARSGESKTVPGMAVYTESGCKHMVCRQSDTVIDRAEKAQLGETHWVPFEPRSIAVNESMPPRYISEAPPPAVPSVHPFLSVALRI